MMLCFAIEFIVLYSFSCASKVNGQQFTLAAIHTMQCEMRDASGAAHKNKKVPFRNIIGIHCKSASRTVDRQHEHTHSTHI